MITFDSILKLRPSVAIVKNDNIVEFFISDIRKSVVIEVSSDIIPVLCKLNGSISVGKWMSDYCIKSEQINGILELLDFLNKNNILINVDAPYSEDFYTFHRVFSFLENYYHAQSKINEVFLKLKKSKILIIGLGSVGTWVSFSLAMSGVGNFILVDPDLIDISNLHRQFSFKKEDIGELKIKVLADRLLNKFKNIDIQTIEDTLDVNFWNKHNINDIDLIINCADQPTVDETSKLIGEYAMKNDIPHIIGGGYNLHQTLIGQVIIPGQTACVECFRKNLDDINIIDTSNIERLENKNRKVGVFPPLTAISASITANEAFKLLSGLKDEIVMTNKRTEFSIEDLNFSSVLMKKRKDCNWCSKHGKYYKVHWNKN